MDIRETLLKEHSKANAMKIANFIENDEQKFAELMELFFTDEYRVAQRAAYAFLVSVERHPELVKPYLKKLVSQMKRKDVHDAVKRNVVRALQFVEIPSSLEGIIYSHCFDLVEDMSEPIAVRAFALTVATRIAKQEPVLIDELCLAVEKYMKDPSPALRVRIRKLYAEKRN